MNNENRKNKHLTLEDRIEIQECLEKGMTFKAIASRVTKDQTTISKEVKKHITYKDTKVGDPTKAGMSTSTCPKLLRAPFVCNFCEKRRYKCQYQKQLYLARFAQKEYEALLVESREGIPLNKQVFYDNDRLISDGIKKGQHLYHIIESNDLGVSKSTVYRHLHKGYLSVSSIEFPRIVKFKSRKQHHQIYVPKAAKIGRTYDDFLAFVQENNINNWIEMDTVIGRIGGKVILTMFFTQFNFMTALLLDNKTAAEASTNIIVLKKSIASIGNNFGNIFPLILTDNGGEFSDVATFENDLQGAKETSIFFCDPYKSYQKPNVEKNHTIFRDIVPKGKSFDGFTQETVNLIFSHVNSVKRKVLNGKTPYELFTYIFGIDTAKILGICPISAEDVIQSPKLLKE